MRVDFSLLLVALTALTGLIWLIDSLLFAKRRRQRAPEQEKVPVVVDYSRSFFPIILAVLIFRSFLFEPFKIPSSSMMPTLLIGDFILVNKFAYGIRLPVLHRKVIDIGEPERGDVAVFRYPQDVRVDYIKRIIGIPGDTITYRNKTLYINDLEVPQEHLGRYVGSGRGREMSGAMELAEQLPGTRYQILQRPNVPGGGEATWQVPAGHYFALGDNRDNSLDSRYWQFVPEENLVGRASLIWWSWDTQKDGIIDFSRLGTVIR
ncbi:MAG: signal peptidase I [Xanthomonadales bacterium]|nr:signal peptidase I [Xanthomonadales bacterium]